ncbi:hypothetical protein PSTG_15840 [Puccinia striiformis f. sp. tritici PST-78]|uniref:Uncharacterized protein n=1 Tax=Puccinia striiformis f. sp. tritici PST-78 TaxID=1165861 RepID=A0A0L0UVE1_9BASI|nr:hypothetical protein PSTG_15840 [Puccinia striiformis f. sp. tritici PST-78]
MRLASILPEGLCDHNASLREYNRQLSQTRWPGHVQLTRWQSARVRIRWPHPILTRMRPSEPALLAAGRPAPTHASHASVPIESCIEIVSAGGRSGQFTQENTDT